MIEYRLQVLYCKLRRSDHYIESSYHKLALTALHAVDFRMTNTLNRNDPFLLVTGWLLELLELESAN